MPLCQVPAQPFRANIASQAEAHSPLPSELRDTRAATGCSARHHHRRNDRSRRLARTAHLHLLHRSPGNTTFGVYDRGLLRRGMAADIKDPWKWSSQGSLMVRCARTATSTPVPSLAGCFATP